MNKRDLVNAVAEVVGTKKEAKIAVETVFNTITEALKQEDSVTLLGFGTFRSVQRNARMGRNPQTGEEIEIDSRRVPRFRPGKALKQAVE